MPTRGEIVAFAEPAVPPGESPWVEGAGPGLEVTVVDPDPAWPLWYADLAARVRLALGWRVLTLDHVGSTAVPGLAAKPVIDVQLVVADPGDEPAYVPALEATGFQLRVREPWLSGHRMLRHLEPACNLHVHGPDAPEAVRQRLFRDWLVAHEYERALYVHVKREAAAAAAAAGEHVMQYNERKQAVVREIYHRAFLAAGLLPG